MAREKYVIVVPGLGDGIKKMQLATNHWRNFGLEPVVQYMNWRDGKDFTPKLNNLTALVDELSAKGTVSIVGTSAGGSVAINTFLERCNVIDKVVNVCGRLRVGTHTGIHSFEARTATSRAFAQSVILCEQRQNELSSAERQKILTIHALLGDELVPASTTTIDGANNITIPTPEHMFSITMALTLLSKPLIDFLTKENE